MELLHRSRICVATDLTALPDILVWFDQFNQAALPYPVWLQCQLAIAEAFTNAVRHAHRHQSIETPIEVEVTVFKQAVELRIWDRGEWFDLQQRLDAMPPAIDPSAEGGRGLKLMQQIADTLSYTRFDDQRNCLLIVKHYA